jgi:transposase
VDEIDNRARLRALIAQAGLTQKKAAALIGVHETTIRRWLMAPETLSSRRVTKRDLMALEAAIKIPKTRAITHLK